MPVIFISYRRDDTAYVAGMLGNRLRTEFGESAAYIDFDAIPFGIDFREHIVNAVSECDILLAIIGDRWLGSRGNDETTRRIDDPADFVRLEIETALARNIPVIPILTGKAEMPSQEDLPETLQPLAFRNAAELRTGRDTNYHMDLLIRNLQHHFSPDQENKKTSDREDECDSKLSVQQGTAKLRFVRDTYRWAGIMVSFKIRVDGELVGTLPVKSTVDVSVSPGEHQLEATCPTALYGAHQEISIEAGETRVWNVGFDLTGGVRMSEA